MTIAMPYIVQMALNRSPLPKLTHTIHPPLTPPRFISSRTSPSIRKPSMSKRHTATRLAHRDWASCTSANKHVQLSIFAHRGQYRMVYIEVASGACCRLGWLRVHDMGQHELYCITSRFPCPVPDARGPAQHVHGTRICTVAGGAWIKQI